MRKNWFVYGIVVIILFVFIYIRDSTMTYVAFYAVLIMPIFSYLMLQLLKNKIQFTESLSMEFVAKNEQTNYKVEIQNRGVLPCFFAMLNFNLQHLGLDSNLDVVYFSLKRKANQTFTAQISGQYRGVYEVGVREVVVYDFLGLFKARPRYTPQVRLIIAPHVQEMVELLTAANVEGETTTRRHLPGADLSIATELRQYLPTDSYRQIHWKATAKKGELISKNPQEIEQPRTTFLVDNRRIIKALSLMLEREDKLIDTVASAMAHCFAAGHQLSLQFFQAQFLRSDNWSGYEFTADFTRLYHEVCALPFGEFGDLARLLADYLNSNNNCDNLYVFTQEITTEALAVLQEIRVTDVEVTLFLFGRATDGMRLKLAAIGVECIIW